MRSSVYTKRDNDADTFTFALLDPSKCIDAVFAVNSSHSALGPLLLFGRMQYTMPKANITLR